MPQLVKGGKYVFGWSLIKNDGGVVIPTEALAEYKLPPGTDIVLVSGSKTSGGFIVCKKSLLEESSIGGFLRDKPEVINFNKVYDKPFTYKTRNYFFTKIREPDTLKLNNDTLESYGLKTGDPLLSGRGSYLGIAMIVKGSIVECARKHPEVKYF